MPRDWRNWRSHEFFPRRTCLSSRASQGFNGNEEAVSPFGDSLDDASIASVILEDAAQFGNRALQDVIGDKGVGPDLMDEDFFIHNLAAGFGKAHQDIHDLRFKVSGCSVF